MMKWNLHGYTRYTIALAYVVCVVCFDPISTFKLGGEMIDRDERTHLLPSHLLGEESSVILLTVLNLQARP